jgi:hypothetical protein
MALLLLCIENEPAELEFSETTVKLSKLALFAVYGQKQVFVLPNIVLIHIR